MVKRLGVLALGVAAISECSPSASARALPGWPLGPVLERQTTAPGCPLGFALLPGTVCPPSEQIPPDEAERDCHAAAAGRPDEDQARALLRALDGLRLLHALRADGARVRGRARQPGPATSAWT